MRIKGLAVVFLLGFWSSLQMAGAEGVVLKGPNWREPVVQPVMPPPSRKSGMSPDLMAILSSLFGGSRSGTGGSSSCSGSGELACASGGSGGSESYSLDAFENVRPTATGDLSSPYKILGPFKKYFDTCTERVGLGTCKFINLGIKGDKAHQARRSCHNSMQAIDVGPLTCSSGRRVLPSDPGFFDVASCMANQSNNELEVIFHKAEGANMMRDSNHKGHMHIQLKNCAMVFG